MTISFPTSWKSSHGPTILVLPSILIKLPVLAHEDLLATVLTEITVMKKKAVFGSVAPTQMAVDTSPQQPTGNR